MNTAAELRRLRYLQAMGVDAVVARRPLPGARPLPRLGLCPGSTATLPAAPAAKAPVNVPEPRTAKAGGAADPRRALREALRDSERRERGSAGAAAEQPQRAGAAAPGERFSIAAVVSAGRLWIEELDGDALAREQVQLMVAIGRALDHPAAAAPAPRVSQFDWPLSANPQLDLGPAEASAALHSFLRRQLTDLHCAALMCCGEAAAARVGAAALEVPVHRLPATRQLLASPDGKRELWRALKP